MLNKKIEEKYLKEIESIKNSLKISDKYIKLLEEKLTINGVVNCVYVVTERDNYGDQTFKGVFANKEQAIEFLAKDGLTESNIDEINEIELN